MKKLMLLAVASLLVFAACEGKKEEQAQVQAQPAPVAEQAVAKQAPAEERPAMQSIDWDKALEMNAAGAVFVDVRNPMNIHRVSRIDIRPEVVDCIVFWTKNAGNIIPHLDQLKDYKYYFQYTINPYNKLIEENVPLKKYVVENFRLLSEIIGPKNG